MIRDIVIIKDGLPLLSKHFAEHDNPSKSNKAFSEGDSLIMVSGFFTALNSFSDSFEDLGTISELKLSNNELKLSFLKDSSIPNLIYLATYDDKSKSVNVLRALRKIAQTFMRKYDINKILNWNGRRDYFESFGDILTFFVEEERKEREGQFKERVIDLFKEVEDKINEESNFKILKQNNREEINLPDYCRKVPRFSCTKKINPKYYLTGDTSINVFHRINGKRSIAQITQELEMQHEQVYNICKNLVKLGFINLQ
ncbi:MAG: hypothetical protein EU548_09040 [Promethearchaeota archaeon]|nr:MAG: hypothetical protein EU548_09040 [Candidatus Lokiarchaeota archaeon]